VGLSSDDLEEKESAALRAHNLIFNDRNKDYGHPIDDYTATGKLWTIVLNEWLRTYHNLPPIPDIPPDVAILMMIQVKASRLSRNLNHEDGWVDTAGYAGCGWRVKMRQKTEGNA
jgi:hypothetical protein